MTTAKAAPTDEQKPSVHPPSEDAVEEGKRPRGSRVAETRDHRPARQAR